ncbi:MAG: CGNR zinc finger domain-containing protein [Sporichthyaceae bacterium]
MRTVRILDGEPLAIDLVNTLWIEHGELVDALADVEGARAWIDLQGIDCPTTESARASLVTARTAIREHIGAPDSPSARAALNAVLGWGFRRPVVTASGVVAEAETDDPAARAGWLAALDYADLLAAGTGRFGRCAHEQCVLHFHDASARGQRRWCSMATCGNRAKAARHYAKSRTD